MLDPELDHYEEQIGTIFNPVTIKDASFERLKHEYIQYMENYVFLKDGNNDLAERHRAMAVRIKEEMKIRLKFRKDSLKKLKEYEQEIENEGVSDESL